MLRVCKASAQHFWLHPWFYSAIENWVNDETLKLSNEPHFKALIASELQKNDEELIEYFVINLVGSGILKKSLGISGPYSEDLLQLLYNILNIQKIPEDKYSATLRC